MRPNFRSLLLSLGVMGAGAALLADEVDYLGAVKPILHERCFACHGALKQEGGLRVDTAAQMQTGGDSGAAVVPGAADESLLIERISAAEESERMPPEGKPLSVAEIDLISRWIQSGAQGPVEEQPEEDPSRHWAFQPIVRPELPFSENQAQAGAASANPIDAFLVQARAARNLKPVGEVQKSLLLRRVYLDLIGLPPTRGQLQAFLKDTRPDAYERVVKQLLASPHYGERWGRHWMDVWRYADGHGFRAPYGDTNSHKHIWHWRDWIVESLNADKGYDQMLMEMLAADERTPADQDALRATGFLARNYYLYNRTTWLDGVIEHASKAILGLTMNCAKCHDHKYDPISQDDYYALRAIFEPYHVRLDPLPGETDLERDGLPRAYDLHLDRATYVHVRGDEMAPDKSRAIAPGVPKILQGSGLRIQPVSLSIKARAPLLREYVLHDQMQAAQEELAAAQTAWEQAQRRVAKKPAEPRKAEAARLAANAAKQVWEAARLKPERIRTAHALESAKLTGEPAERIQSAEKAALAALQRYELALAHQQIALAEQKLQQATEKAKSAAKQALQTAKNQLAQAEKSAAAPKAQYTPLPVSYKVFDGPDETPESRRQPYPATSTGRRTALAEWIVDPHNPLTARVAVNHIWLRHMGQPLVESVSDFGRQTPRPPLQSLLDWLAVELRDNQWSMKHLHRLIVTSQTYRLNCSSAEADPATVAADPNNHFYWRRQPMRMQAQDIRDSLLQLAGALDPQIGGPSIPPDQDLFVLRRSLYFTHTNDGSHEFLAMFDDANVLECYQRAESIIPQQALAMSNSKLTLTMTRKITARLLQARDAADDAAFVREAYLLVLAAAPDAEEQALCLKLMAETRELAAARGHDDPHLRARQNLVHALLNHNDFVTIR